MRDDFADRVISHGPALRGYALSLTRDSVDAQDLLQDTYCRAVSNRDKFSQDTNLSAWLHSIMRNSFINEYHKRQHRKTRAAFTQDDRYAELPDQTTRNGGETLVALREIRREIAKVPPEPREAFLMHFEGHKYAEIAEKFNVPVGTIRTRIHTARKVLKNALREHGEAYGMEKKPRVHRG